MTRTFFLHILVGFSASFTLSACSSSSGESSSENPAMQGTGGGDGGGTQTAGPPQSVPLSGLDQGNGFDDLRYSRTLQKIIAPGNYSGNIYLIDPETLEVTTIGGFTKDPTWNGSDTQGPATVDEGAGYIFVGDRSSTMLSVVDPQSQMIVG